jgi:ABC-2 type transport system permease protein
MPVLALAAVGILLSTLSRNSAAAVVGTLMVALVEQLTQIVPVLDAPAAQRWMLTAQLNAWETLFRTPLDAAPIVHAAYVSFVYLVVSLVVAWIHFVRRDITG